MISAMMTLVHFFGFRAECERKHLMSETDAKERDISFGDFLNDGHGVGAASGGGVAGAVGEEDAIGFEREDLFGGRGSGHDRDSAAEIGQEAQYVSLNAVVKGCNMKGSAFGFTEALRPLPICFMAP